MRTTVRIIVCGAVALMSTAQTRAGISQLHHGLWELERRVEGPEGSEPQDYSVRKECVPHSADLVDDAFSRTYPSGLTYASSGSTLIRAALDDRRTVIHTVMRMRHYVTMQSPWMVRDLDFSPLKTGESVVRKTDGLGMRFRYREYGYGERKVVVEGGTPRSTMANRYIYVSEGRRVGDCASGFRFMTLREIWRSIFQWGF